MANSVSDFFLKISNLYAKARFFDAVVVKEQLLVALVAERFDLFDDLLRSHNWFTPNGPNLSQSRPRARLPATTRPRFPGSLRHGEMEQLPGKPGGLNKGQNRSASPLTPFAGLLTDPV